MSNRLGSARGLSYVGTNADQPPNWTFENRDPDMYDINASLGDLWLNIIDEKVWVLVSLAGTSTSKGSLATWIQFAGGAGVVESLTGNTGGAVFPDPSTANINVVGDGIGITTIGTPAAHNLTLALVGGGNAAQSFPTDSGTATPTVGIINIKANNAIDNSGS